MKKIQKKSDKTDTAVKSSKTIKTNRTKKTEKPETTEDRLFKIQPEWIFKNVYKGITDPQIEKDITAIESAYTTFAKKYSSPEAIKKFTTESTALKSALEAWKDLMEVTGTAKPAWYLHLVCDIDTTNNKAKALSQKAEQRIIESANAILFFNLELAKIDTDNQAKFLNDPQLAEYNVYLNSIFEIAKYNLTEKEEKILSLKSAPGHSMWVDMQKKYLTRQTVAYKGKQIPITEAQAIKADLPQKDRRALHKEVVAKYKEISFIAEAELSAVVTNKRITDELRGFTKPYEATVLGYQNSIKSVESLVSSVEAKFKDGHEFFKLKAQVLGLPKLTLAELGTKMSLSNKKYSVGEGVGLVHAAFDEVKPEYAELFAKFVSNGQIDFFPKAGKRNGAYCSGGIGIPTHILLNHVDDGNSISTIAHEMGHAIHFELSKKQNALYEDFTISIAEVASTFFENVLFDFMYNRASDTEKKTMLLEKIQDNLFTIHGQISYFNFEKELHAKVKEKGQLSASEIAEIFLKYRKQFLGPAFEYTEDDGYGYVAVPHFRYFFYVYAYAYGQLIANALYAEYKKNPAFLEKIEYFLSAGGSKKPDDVFKDIGIDVTDPAFFNTGLDEITKMIREAKKMLGRVVKN